MKKDIHPKYEKTKISCVCGNSFETRSTGAPELHVELCSACHPFFTGKQKFIDSAGRVDKFRARLEAAQKNDKKKVTDGKKGTTESKEELSNKEKLAEIKKDIKEQPIENEQTSPKPITVTQEMSSDVDAAAESELKASNN